MTKPPRMSAPRCAPAFWAWRASRARISSCCSPATRTSAYCSASLLRDMRSSSCSNSPSRQQAVLHRCNAMDSRALVAVGEDGRRYGGISGCIDDDQIPRTRRGRCWHDRHEENRGVCPQHGRLGRHGPAADQPMHRPERGSHLVERDPPTASRDMLARGSRRTPDRRCSSRRRTVPFR